MPLNKHLRSLWLDAGYPPGTGSAAVTPPPDLDYRRVYYITSAEYAIKHYANNNVTTIRARLAGKSFNIGPLEASVPLVPEDG